MSRLTNEQRKQIRIKAVADKFHDKISKAEKSFINELEIAAKKTVPKWYTTEIKNAGMVKTSCVAHVKGIKDPHNIDKWNAHQRVNYNIYNHYPIKYQLDLKLTKTIQNKMDKLVKLKDEKKNYDTKLRSALVSFNTHKRLVESIPEIDKFTKGLNIISTQALVSMKEIDEVRKLIKG